MTAIILTWNPDRWQEWDFQAAREQVVETGQFLSRWTVSPHQKIPVGSDTWLLLQGGHGKEFIGPGLIGHGKTRSEPHPEPHPSNLGDGALYVDVAFDAFLPFGEQLAPEMLLEAVPGVPWESVQGSGLALEPADEAKVRQLWSEFCPPPVADPTMPPPGTYPDEALSRVEVNRYERSPEARRACLAHHGTACAACGFSFEITYGEIGKNFIQVHHIVPVSQLGSDYVLDPVTDLVPLCANCHAMAHYGVSIPRTVAELRRIIADAGYLKGQALTPSELEAQRDARRILGLP
jgi:5-methylcytosine-specific restriction protein A